jgi:hypothetical protein
MAETIRVKLYFLEFNSTEKDNNRVVERTWGSITNWLYKAFSVDVK